MSKKTFEVDFVSTVYKSYEVEASSKDEARSLAYDKLMADREFANDLEYQLKENCTADSIICLEEEGADKDQLYGGTKICIKCNKMHSALDPCHIEDPCPECGKELECGVGGGVKCSCGYTFCY